MTLTKVPDGVVAFEVQQQQADGSWLCVHAGRPENARHRVQQYAHYSGEPALRLAWVPDGGGFFIDGGPLGVTERGRGRR